MRDRDHTDSRGADRKPVEASEAVLSALSSFGQELADIKAAVTDVQQMLRHQPVGKEWHSTGELAEAMGVSVYTVAERWCNGGRIACEKDPDTGKWRIPGAEFERLVRGGGLKPRKKQLPS
jgi:hypothetical protein